MHHVNVVDMSSGKIRKNMTVVISGNRIKTIGKKVDRSEGDTIIDARQKFLIPGLWDMHVHVRNEESIFFPLLIANGITGVRDMHNPNRYSSIGKWKDSINIGELTAPRIGAAAGRIIDGYGDSRNLGFVVVKDVEQARLAVRQMKSYGADFIKIYNRITEAEYMAIADEAKNLGMFLAGHLPYGISLDTVVPLGLRSIEHVDGLTIPFSSNESSIRKLLSDSSASISRTRFAKLRELAYQTYDSSLALEKISLLKKYGVFVCPTLWIAATINLKDFLLHSEGALLQEVPPPILDKWTLNPLPNFTRADSILYFAYYQRALQMVGLLHRSGVQIMAGTDSSPVWNYVIPGYSLHFELALYVKAGMTPYEALKTATVYPAVFLNRQHDYGDVREGLLADLVLLKKNPLLDINNTRKIDAVIINGRFLDRKALDALLQHAIVETTHYKGVK